MGCSAEKNIRFSPLRRLLGHYRWSHRASMSGETLYSDCTKSWSPWYWPNSFRDIQDSARSSESEQLLHYSLSEPNMKNREQSHTLNHPWLHRRRSCRYKAPAKIL